VEGRRWSVAYLPPVKGQGDDPTTNEKLKRGDELLSAARDAMTAEGRTPVTPEDVKTTLSRFQLACDGSILIIELWDFAGEILAPTRLGDAESHGHALGKRIADADGMLLLAPADDASDEAALDAERTDQVIQAIARLHDWIKSHDELADVRERPFALLVTKADRNPEGAQALEAHGEPAVRAMHAIESLIGADRTRWFALSTLPGHARPEALLAPLIWAVDTIDSKALATARTVRSRSVLPVGFKHKLRASESLTRLIHRRKTSRSSDQILSAARQEVASFRKSLFGWGAAVVAMLFAMTYGTISLMYQSIAERHVSAVKDPNAAEADILSAQEFFAQYDQGLRSYLLLGLSAEEIADAKHNASEVLAKRAWNKVQAQSDPAAKKSHAEQLLGSYPGTSYATEAVQILESISKDENARKYEEWTGARKLEAEDPLIDLDALGELAKRLTSVPTDLQETETQREQRELLLNEVKQREKDQINSGNVANLIRAVEQAARDGLPSECLRVLKQNSRLLADQDVKQLLTWLKSAWPECVKDCVKRAKNESAFDKGLEELRRTIQYQSVAAEILGIAIEKDIDVEIARLTDAWDYHEYELLRTHQQLRFADDYLASGHRKCMEQYVSKWTQWQEGLNERQKLDLILSEVQWDPKHGPTDPMLDFSVNDKEVFVKRRIDNDAAGARVPLNESSCEIDLQPSASVNIELKLWDYDAFNNDDLVIEKKFEVILRDLIGAGLSLRLEDGAWVHLVKFKLGGYDIKPELKSWMPCK
jgi:hypothetical protein